MPERLGKMLPEFTSRATELGKKSQKDFNTMMALHPDYGMISRIRRNLGIKLHYYSIFDKESHQLLYYGYSQPNSYQIIYGLPINNHARIIEHLQKMEPQFWIYANLQFPKNRVQGLLKILIGETDYCQYPLNLKILVDKTSEIRSLNFREHNRLSNEEKETMVGQLAFLSLANIIIGSSIPVTDSSKFPVDYFKQKETSSFLLPELL
jgi:hypothetical protein